MTGKRNHGTVLSFSDVENADQAMHGQFFFYFLQFYGTNLEFTLLTFYVPSWFVL
jgi:hypothetical protein